MAAAQDFHSKLSRGIIFLIFPKKEYLSSSMRIILLHHLIAYAQKEDSQNGT